MDLPGWSGDRPVTPRWRPIRPPACPECGHTGGNRLPRVRGERSRRGRSEHGRAATRGRRCGRGRRGGRTAGAAASSPSSRRNPVPGRVAPGFRYPVDVSAIEQKLRTRTANHSRSSVRSEPHGPAVGAERTGRAPAPARTCTRAEPPPTRKRTPHACPVPSRTSASGLAAGRAGARIRASGPEAHSCTSTPRMILPSRRSWYPSLICSREYCLVTSSSSLSWPAS